MALVYYLEYSIYWEVAAAIFVVTNMIRIALIVSSSLSNFSFIFPLLQHMLSNMHAYRLFQLFLI